MRKWIILLIPILLLMGCEIGVNNQNQDPQSSPQDPNPDVEQRISLLNFFPLFPIEKDFKGEGNEFAQYKETFYSNDGVYYPAIIENGGTRILRIYKVTKDEISIVLEQPEFYEETIPSISTLEPSFYEHPILTSPIEEGKEIGEWKIIAIHESITVPFGSFTDVIVLEKVNEDGSVNKQYWAKKWGKIKEEYIQKVENGNLIKITSELQTTSTH